MPPIALTAAVATAPGLEGRSGGSVSMVLGREKCRLAGRWLAGRKEGVTKQESHVTAPSHVRG